MTTAVKPELPSWVVSHCDWCGEQMWDGSLSFTPHGTSERVHVHGFDRAACERADRRTQADLPTEYVRGWVRDDYSSDGVVGAPCPDCASEEELRSGLAGGTMEPSTNRGGTALTAHPRTTGGMTP